MPDLSTPDDRLLDELFRLTDTTGTLRFTTASDLGSSTATLDVDPVELPATAGPSLAERLELLAATEATLASAASMLPDDDTRLAEWRGQLDAFVSTAFTDAQVDEAIEPLVDEADRLRTSVVPPDSFTFTLTSREGVIPMTIGNTGDEPLTVVVELSSPRLLFPDGSPVVTVPPGGREIEVPVEARANGTSRIEVQLRTPAGEDLGDPVRITTRVSSLSGLAQLVSATLVLMLLTWWFSHWRARRREALGLDQTRTGPDDADRAPGDAPDDASLEDEPADA